jgi:hypothetical protein
VSPTRIAKRDGREVPFDEEKIRSAVARAQAAVGEDDPHLPAEVSTLVRLALDERGSAEGATAAVPDIERIQDLVERALIELGRAQVAKAYIVYRERRAQVREALLVQRVGAPARGGDVTVEDRQTLSRWDKGRIVAALMGEAELPRALAERVAARVEARVFELGQKRVSTGLVRELVDGELMEMGLEAALRRQTSIGVPLHDLRGILALGEDTPDPHRAADEGSLAAVGLEARVSGEVLRRHALFELLPREAVERHLAGDLEVVGLESLVRPLWLSVPCELWLTRSEVASSDAFALLDALARTLRAVGRGVVLEDGSALIAALTARARGDEALGQWLAALAALARAAGRRVDLSGVEGCDARAPRRLQALARLIVALDAAGDNAWLPRLFVDERALEALSFERDEARERALERLLGSGRLVPTWAASGERHVAPGCVRADGERGALSCGAALALNLPRLALRAGPWREDRLLERAAELVAGGAQALAAVGALQQRTRPGGEIAGVRARASFALAPVGLREALAWLGDGEVRPEQGARILGFLGDHLRRLSQQHRTSFVLTPFFGARAAERFARLDRSAPQRAQRRLFGPGQEQGPDAPYGEGWRLSPAPGFVPWAAEAELLRTVAPGALHPLPQEHAREGDLRLGEAWQRFARLRRELLPEEPPVAEPGPGLFEPWPASWDPDPIAPRPPSESHA